MKFNLIEQKWILILIIIKIKQNKKSQGLLIMKFEHTFTQIYIHTYLNDQLIVNLDINSNGNYLYIQNSLKFYHFKILTFVNFYFLLILFKILFIN